MMKNWRHILLAASASLAAMIAGSSAFAADDLLDAPEVTISAAESATSGVYLRGDIGYAPWSHEGDPSFNFGGGAGGSFDDARFGKPLSGGVGIGYQFNDMVRADLTTDYFQGDFEGKGEMTGACTGWVGIVPCDVAAQADYRAVSVMANGYIDLATLAGFTPYVGAGIGSTRFSWDTTTVSITCMNCGPSPLTVSGDVKGDSSWRFTYAVMAGFSYDVSDRLKLDFGYRYSDMAGGDFYRDSGASASDDGFARHEFRAGLRFSLW